MKAPVREAGVLLIGNAQIAKTIRAQMKRPPVSTRRLKRAAMTREERKVKYGDILRNHFQAKGVI